MEAQGDPFRRGLPTLQTSLTLPELPRKTRHPKKRTEFSLIGWRGLAGKFFVVLGGMVFCSVLPKSRRRDGRFRQLLRTALIIKKQRESSAETPFFVSKTAFCQPKSRINKNENCSYYKIRQTLSMFPACAYRRPRRKAGQSRRDSRKDRRRPQPHGAAQPVPKRGRKREN